MKASFTCAARLPLATFRLPCRVVVGSTRIVTRLEFGSETRTRVASRLQGNCASIVGIRRRFSCCCLRGRECSTIVQIRVDFCLCFFKLLQFLLFKAFWMRFMLIMRIWCNKMNSVKILTVGSYFPLFECTFWAHFVIAVAYSQIFVAKMSSNIHLMRHSNNFIQLRWFYLGSSFIFSGKRFLLKLHSLICIW